MKNSKVLFLIFCTFLLSGTSQTFAQFQQLATPKDKNRTQQFDQSLRVQSTSLSIPFWEDFSQAGIDSLKWISTGVTHSFTVGNSPPSIGVVVLDGVNEYGRPYSNIPTEQGETDKLISRPINLSGINPGEVNTVFLSFFWQPGGKAELPDSSDELKLMFLDSVGNWNEVWKVTGNLDAEQFFFTSQMIEVLGVYQHEDFQFMFQTTGRRSGPFDSWILDYIFLDKGRSINEPFFMDRALTQKNSSPYEKYSAIPLFELKRNPEKYWTEVQNEFKNLSNRFQAMEFTVEIRDKQSQTIIQKINNNTPFNPVPLAEERRGFTSNSINALTLPEIESDWKVVSYLSSGDGLLSKSGNGDTLYFDQVDFRINDTARTVIPIRDYFAYDNGSPDYSAGINQRSGMLAVRYEVEGSAYIKGLSINFTNFNQIGNAVDLMIWDGLDSPPLFVKEFLIPDKENLHDLTYFALDSNIMVSDEFFIGFMQFTNDFIYVGLDKTRDSGLEIFYNVAGSWQQNEEVLGSLMMRPHVSLTAPVEEESEIPQNPLFYPNPVQDKLYVEGELQNLTIYDSYGRRINLPSEDNEQGIILNFVGQRSGIYLVNFLHLGKQRSIRILVK